MKHGRSFTIALAVSLLAPLPLLAQGGGQGRGGMGGMMSARLLVEQGSVEYLVTKAADLELTADQTTQLESIGAKWAEATKESREQIRSMLPQPGQRMGGDRDAMMQRMRQMQPLAQKLNEDDEEALVEALALLDDAQQTKAKALLEERRQSARPRRGGG
jgi:Spy/CpxP family protein refolding chaperone